MSLILATLSALALPATFVAVVVGNIRSDHAAEARFNDEMRAAWARGMMEADEAYAKAGLEESKYVAADLEQLRERALILAQPLYRKAGKP